MARISENTLKFLDEFADGNPEPEETWFRENDFDPNFYRRDLRAAERSGYIEVNRQDPDDWGFRFTAKGRAVAPTEKGADRG